MTDADRGIEATTLACAIEALARRGFTDSLQVVGDRLRDVETGATFAPEDVTIREFRRFEGISDPDDMAIVYALETRGGVRGTLADAFGVYADPAVSAVMSRVPIREAVGAARGTAQGGTEP